MEENAPEDETMITRFLSHPYGWTQRVTLSTWDWDVFDWLTGPFGYPMDEFIADCEEGSADHDLDFAMRYYLYLVFQTYMEYEPWIFRRCLQPEPIKGHDFFFPAALHPRR